MCALHALHGIALQLLLVDLHLVPGPHPHRRLPHHHHIVLRRASHRPVLRLARGPAEIGRSGRVAWFHIITLELHHEKNENRARTSVNEQQLRWPVFLIIRRLLLPDERQIPDVYPPVARCGGEDCGVVGRP